MCVCVCNKGRPTLPFPAVLFNDFNENTHICQQSVTETDKSDKDNDFLIDTMLCFTQKYSKERKKKTECLRKNIMGKSYIFFILSCVFKPNKLKRRFKVKI